MFQSGIRPDFDYATLAINKYNLIKKSAGWYGFIDPETGEVLMNAETGKPVKVNGLGKVYDYLNGNPEYCLPSTINLSIDGLDAEAAFLCLGDIYSFSNGSACNSSSHSLSYVLDAMGLDEKQKAEAIRLSWDGSEEIDFSPFLATVKSMI